jgi:hypothetical protein
VKQDFASDISDLASEPAVRFVGSCLDVDWSWSRCRRAPCSGQSNSHSEPADLGISLRAFGISNMTFSEGPLMLSVYLTRVSPPENSPLWILSQRYTIRRPLRRYAAKVYGRSSDSGGALGYRPREQGAECILEASSDRSD